MVNDGKKNIQIVSVEVISCVVCCVQLKPVAHGEIKLK